MTEHPARHARIVLAGLTALALTATAACDADSPVAAALHGRPSGHAGSQPRRQPRLLVSSTSSPSSTHDHHRRAPPAASSSPPAMTPAQRAGQLLMVGLQPTGSSRALAAQVKAQGLGGVIYLGGWSGGGRVDGDRLGPAAGRGRRTACWSPPTRRAARSSSCAGPGSPGCRRRAPRLQSGVATEETERRGVVARARTKAGVNVNLAPVADTVPTSLGAANQPIGRYRRDFAPGSPKANATYAAAFVRGTLAAGIAPTVKHFPGLGRITGNTDVTSSGITDRTATADDPYLAPFARRDRGGGAPRDGLLGPLPQARPRQPGDVLQGGHHRPAARPTGFRRRGHHRRRGRRQGRRRRPGRRSARPGSSPRGATSSSPPRPPGPDDARRPSPRSGPRSPAFAAQVDAAAARVLDLKADLGLVKCS